MTEKPAIIDCHFHVWDLRRFKYQFPSPEHGTIYRDVTLDEYADNIRNSPISKAIFVQVEPEVAVEEAEWILNQAPSYPFLQGFVAGFKFDDSQFQNILNRFKDEKMFLGVRNVFDYYEKDDWILSDVAIKGISLLVEHGLPYHVLCNQPKHRKYIPELLRQFPQHKFTIDHLAKPFIMDDAMETSQWHSWIGEVAKYPNVYCKISGQLLPHSGGLTEREKRGEFPDHNNSVKRCLEVFGVDRCMFGTDWPVCNLHGMTSAQDSYDVADALLSHLTRPERDKIFGLNCTRFYNLEC